MCSFQETREALLLAFDSGVTDEKEFVLLYEESTSKNPSFGYEDYEKFDLNSIDPATCKADFRVEKNDLFMLKEALNIPDRIVCHQRSICDGMEALCMVLKRLAYPCRYSDMIPLFARPVPVISMLTNEVIDYIYDNHHHRITAWNQDLLMPLKLEAYAAAVHDKGGALNNCFGFIDGTVRPICRPGEHQRIVYNGHKRVHAIKFQSVTLPNGIIAQLFGPVEGRKHDSGMLADSGLPQQLSQYAFSSTGDPMCLYGDPAYPLRIHLQAPFRNAVLTPQMHFFNESMSSVRESVEWLFADIVNYFKFLDFKKNLKLQLSAVGKFYIVAAILRNALTCMYFNETSKFFGLEPPTLQEYFS